MRNKYVETLTIGLAWALNHLRSVDDGSLSLLLLDRHHFHHLPFIFSTSNSQQHFLFDVHEWYTKITYPFLKLISFIKWGDLNLKCRFNADKIFKKHFLLLVSLLLLNLSCTNSTISIPITKTWIHTNFLSNSNKISSQQEQNTLIFSLTNAMSSSSLSWLFSILSITV